MMAPNGMMMKMMSSEEVDRIQRRNELGESIAIALQLCHRNRDDDETPHYNVDEVLQVAARVNAFLNTGEDKDNARAVASQVEQMFLPYPDAGPSENDNPDARGAANG
jgi:hypothetical protein